MDIEDYKKMTDWNKYYEEHKDEVQKEIEKNVDIGNELDRVIMNKNREHSLKVMKQFTDLVKPYFKPHKSYAGQDLLNIARILAIDPKMFSAIVDKLVAEKYLFQPTVGVWERMPEKAGSQA